MYRGIVGMMPPLDGDESLKQETDDGVPDSKNPSMGQLAMKNSGMDMKGQEKMEKKEKY